MGIVVNFATHRNVKQQRIAQQEKRAQDALMRASLGLRRRRMRGDK
jgi:hypothetical protein